MAWGGIVLEVLSRENYENWSVLVRNHLIGQDLWEVVTSDPPCEEDRDWRKKNAQALHAIQLSCGSDNLTHIRNLQKAKDAWNHLQALYSANSKAKPDIEHGVGNIPLHWFVERGDWKEAKACIHKDPNAVFSTSPSGETALHVAVIAGHQDIVDKLVNTQEERLLEMRDNDGYTALALVAHLNGNTKMAKCMVEKNQALLVMKTKDQIPLLLASARGHKELTRYLYSKTPLHVLLDQSGYYGAMLLTRCIVSEIFEIDVARSLLHCCPQLPLTYEFDNLRPLYALARSPCAFPSGSRFGRLQQLMYNILRLQWDHGLQAITINIMQNVDQDDKEREFQIGQILRILNMKFQNAILLRIPGLKEIYDKKSSHLQVREILDCLCKKVSSFDKAELQKAAAYDAMLEAAKYGTIEFIEAMREANPNLLSVVDENKRGIFSHAVLNRQQKVFQLIQELDGRKEIITSRSDAFGNNMLHLAGLLGPHSDLDSRSGAALQMQREIQWFKAVEKIVHPKCKKMPNLDGKKPHEVFTKNHEELVKAGEKWAKDTSSSFTLIGTLIATIMFAAAFSVPGGNNEETGIPIFLKDKVFTFFIISDALSLFTSSTSVLIFIGILTSRYAENDFLRTLPMKLLFGLLSLFVSVVSMIAAFCAALTMVLKGHTRVIIAAMSLACIPIMVFVPSQLRLFFEIFGSTARSNIFNLKKKKNLF